MAKQKQNPGAPVCWEQNFINKSKTYWITLAGRYQEAHNGHIMNLTALTMPSKNGGLLMYVDLASQG